MALLTDEDLRVWVPQAVGNETMFDDAISMAEGLADEVCKHDLNLASHSEVIDIGPYTSVVRLTQFPVIIDDDHAIAVVDDTSTLTQDTDYKIDQAAGVLYRENGNWASGDRKLTVTYYAGYTSASLPAGLKRALLQLVAWVFDSRGDVGVRQFTQDGLTQTNEEMDGPVPLSISRMFNPWKPEGLS